MLRALEARPGVRERVLRPPGEVKEGCELVVGRAMLVEGESAGVCVSGAGEPGKVADNRETCWRESWHLGSTGNGEGSRCSGRKAQASLPTSHPHPSLKSSLTMH